MHDEQANKIKPAASTFNPAMQPDERDSVNV